jgi:hypothetical protein
LKNKFMTQFRLTFAGALLERLDQPKTIECWQPQKRSIAYREPFAVPIVKGSLRLKEHGESGETSVNVQLIVLTDWMNKLPIASTDAPFIRDDINWHIPSLPFLCYALDDEWRWTLNELWIKGSDSSNIITASSTWCVRNIDSLLTRHLHGHRYGIQKWPKQWGDWSHGKEGVREFEALLKNLKITKSN